MIKEGIRSDTYDRFRKANPSYTLNNILMKLPEFYDEAGRGYNLYEYHKEEVIDELCRYIKFGRIKFLKKGEEYSSPIKIKKGFAAHIEPILLRFRNLSFKNYEHFFCR